MLKTILLILLFVILAVAAVKVAVAIAMVLAMLLSAIVRLVASIVTGVVLLPVGLTRMALTPEPRKRPALPAPAAMGTPCLNLSCRCDNPARARYCRRCGHKVLA